METIKEDPYQKNHLFVAIKSPVYKLRAGDRMRRINPFSRKSGAWFAVQEYDIGKAAGYFDSSGFDIQRRKTHPEPLTIPVLEAERMEKWRRRHKAIPSKILVDTLLLQRIKPAQVDLIMLQLDEKLSDLPKKPARKKDLKKWPWKNNVSGLTWHTPTP